MPLLQLTRTQKQPPVPGAGELKIGELAKVTGKTQRALRLYEELGLLAPSTHTAGGFRVYGPECVERVTWISKLQDLGFTLQQIHELTATGDTSAMAKDAMARVREMFAQKQAEVALQITRLQQLQRELTTSLSFLETCVDECTEHSHGTECCGTCRTHGEVKAPALVEGMRS